MTTLDEINELLIEFLREHKREQLAGHTVARLHDDVHGLREDVRVVLQRVEGVERRVGYLEAQRSPSGRPPGAPRRQLDSVAEINDDDPTAVKAFKKGELAEAVAGIKFVSTLWKVFTALAIVIAAVATTYAAVHK